MRQAEFIGYLAETRCVRTAAAKVGMSREGAYRLRRKRGAEGFCAAWDFILGAPGTPRRKVTLDGLMQRIRHGTYRPVLRRGRYIGTERKADSSALFGMLKRADRRISPAPAAPHREADRGQEKGR
ncbi:hypothetical protein [Parasphingopyxis lamellibrachiae]|uniref:hypothetical protein n=1 Tax=Parasphingopyxis lamellibrachiae TaxID=680125 RepID=UPI000E27F69B|nr:hypothetical protein [Parasphingopyxis lamellibrachiae]